MRTLGFIGTGNMGAALVKGIVNSGIIDAGNIHVYDIDTAKTGALQKEYGVVKVSGNEEVVERSDIIILAVKPGMEKTVLEPCKEKFGESKILVSILAGVPVKRFEEILGNCAKIVRVLPNTPALVGEGMTLLSFNYNVREEEREEIIKLFECVGKAELLDESLMSEVIALSSSSPAYIFMIIEAMADAAVKHGIRRDMAYRIAAQSVLGAAKMVLETGRHPAELKDQVCSPAGTTIEAVSVLENKGLRSAIIEAMDACTKRARELGNKK